MAFENHIIASMNNPNAAEAWREASFQHQWKMYHADRAANLEDHIDVLNVNIEHYRTTCERVQSELQASREENRAVHEDLGDAIDTIAAINLRLEQASERAENNDREAARWMDRASQAATILFTTVLAELIAAWGFVLYRLS